MRLHMDNICETVDQLSNGLFNETPYGNLCETVAQVYNGQFNETPYGQYL